MSEHPPEWHEGYAAAEKRLHFNGACPYTFDRAGVDQCTFDDSVRPKLNAWFDGWAAWLAERGLTYKFTPKGESGLARRQRLKPRHLVDMRAAKETTR